MIEPAAKKTNPAFWKIMKAVLGTYLRRKFHLSAENSEACMLPPPFLLLANHTNFWDPFLLSLYIPEPVYFVTADEYFRNPFLKFLLRLVGAIPKSKFVSDQATVMDILRVKRRGGVIGIFPEGKRNWDGRTDELLFATSKLVKHLKVPVVTALLQGAYLSFPRWARKPRRGRIVVRFKNALTPQDVETMDTETVHSALGRSLTYSDDAFQRGNRILFKGKKLAESLELYLFTCPRCRAFCTMESKGDAFFCRSCHYAVRYGQDGRLTPQEGTPCFQTPGEWADWQRVYLKEALRAYADGKASEPFWEDADVTVRKGGRLIPLKKLSFGQMRLFSDRIEFVNLRKQRTEFEIGRIRGLNVQYSDQFEFYYGRPLYRFSFRSQKTSAYKWVLAVRLLEEQTGKKMLTD